VKSRRNTIRAVITRTIIDGTGGSFALTRASSPSGCICLLRPTPSLAGKPIDWSIDHSAKRRVIAPCPARSRYAESSVPMAGSEITLQSPRACTGALLNERIDRAEGIVDGHKRKAIGHSNARGYSGIRVAKVEQAQPEQSSFFEGASGSPLYHRLPRTYY
jgi:hypothetical protein